MKKMTVLLPCILAELRSMRVFLPFYVLVLSIVCTLLLSILSFVETIPQCLREELDHRLEQVQYSATVLSATKSQAEYLAEIECAEIRISYLVEEMILDSAILEHDTNKAEALHGTILIYAGKHSTSMQIKNGRAPDFSDNDADCFYIWLSQHTAAQLGVTCAEELRINTEYDSGKPLTVAGIYDDDSTTYDYIINASFAELVISENSLSSRQSCTMVFSDYTSCQTAEAKLSALGCTMQATLYETVDSYYDGPRAMQAIFIVIAAVLFGCLGILLYSMNNMLTDMRTHFIGVASSLGAPVNSVIFLYFCLCEPLILLSILFGAIGSRLYIDQTVSMMREYLEVEMQAMDLYTDLHVLFIGWIGANIILLLVFFFLRKKICNITSIALLKQSERGR